MRRPMSPVLSAAPKRRRAKLGCSERPEARMGAFRLLGAFRISLERRLRPT